MTEPRSLEDWAEEIMNIAEACLGKKGQVWGCFANREGKLEEPRDRIVSILRDYAEQEIAKTQFYCGHEVTLLEYANEVSSLRIERDALLAVARAKFEVSDNAFYAGKEWGYLVDEEDMLQLRAVLADPFVQRLLHAAG